MAPVPVRVHAPHRSHSLMNELAHTQWAFRCLVVYARPAQTAQGSRIPGLLTMTLIQINLLTNDQRCLLIEPVYDAASNVTQIDVRPVPSAPFQGTMEKKFWTTPFYECSVGSNKAERIEYTHKELLYYLNDPRVQQRLLRNASFGMSNFWENLVEHLANVRVIAPESVQEFCTMITQLGLASIVNHAV